MVPAADRIVASTPACLGDHFDKTSGISRRIGFFIIVKETVLP
jgi:hypothetical protein